jgi:hypothetical protein
VEELLRNKERAGEKFADRFGGLSWKAAGQNATLIRNFKRSLPGISDEKFNKILSDLTKGEIVDFNKLPGKTSTVAQEDTPKNKTGRKKSGATNPPPKKGDQQTVANQEAQDDPAVSATAQDDPAVSATAQDDPAVSATAQDDPAVSATAQDDPEEELRKSEAKKQELLKKLYEGKNTKEIIAAIDNLVESAYNFLGEDASVGRKLKKVIKDLKDKYDTSHSSGVSGVTTNAEESSRNGLIELIKNGELLNRILKLTGPKIQESDLIGFLN